MCFYFRNATNQRSCFSSRYRIIRDCTCYHDMVKLKCFDSYTALQSTNSSPVYRRFVFVCLSEVTCLVRSFHATKNNLHMFVFPNKQLSLCMNYILCIYFLLPSQLSTSFAGVTNDTNEGSVPFWSNRVRVLLLCMLAHWKHTATPVGLKVSLSGFQMSPIQVCNSERLQIEANGPGLRVHVIFSRTKP